MKAAKFFFGSEAVRGDEVRVQKGEHVGKAGTCATRQGKRILVVSWPGASWSEFWIDESDVAVVR